MILSRNLLNRLDESKHPSRTPTAVLRNFKRNALLEFSDSGTKFKQYKSLVTSIFLSDSKTRTLLADSQKERTQAFET